MAENEKAGNNGQQDFTKFLILTISSIVIMFVVFAGVNYVVMENLITQKIGSLNTSQEELGEEGGDEDQIQKGYYCRFRRFYFKPLRRKPEEIFES